MKPYPHSRALIVLLLALVVAACGGEQQADQFIEGRVIEIAGDELCIEPTQSATQEEEVDRDWCFTVGEDLELPEPEAEGRVVSVRFVEPSPGEYVAEQVELVGAP